MKLMRIFVVFEKNFSHYMEKNVKTFYYVCKTGFFVLAVVEKSKQRNLLDSEYDIRCMLSTNIHPPNVEELMENVQCRT